jgi:hypothetical protein
VSSTVTNDERRITSELVLGPPFHWDCLERRLPDESSRSESESESYVTTDGQPASLSRNKAPFWGLRPDLYYCLTVAGLLI